MIGSLREFFARLAQPGAHPEVESEDALRLATAALLVEMMRMDDEVSAAERAAVAEALRDKFGLPPDEVAALISQAQTQARQAAGYHEFTSLIHRHFSPQRKLALIERLWTVAYADGRLDAHEHHLMRKLADLLYIPQGDFVLAKARARAALGIPPER